MVRLDVDVGKDASDHREKAADGKYQILSVVRLKGC